MRPGRRSAACVTNLRGPSVVAGGDEAAADADSAAGSLALGLGAATTEVDTAFGFPAPGGVTTEVTAAFGSPAGGA